MDIIPLVVGAAIVGVVIAGIAAWAFMAAKVRLERYYREEASAQEASRRESEERHLQSLIDGAIEKFKNVSHAALKENGDEFRALNAGELEHILKPLRDSVALYQDEIRKAQKKTDELEVKMTGHMTALGQAADKFSAGSTNFVNAITGGNKVAGNWGEAVLEQVLADCGLIRDVHYIAQGGGTGNIPDYQVFDAASQKILVIDSKVSWKKYKEASESEDPAVRAAALDEHVESIRRQVDNLGSKGYHKNPTPPKPGYQYLPFTAMFVPSDAALWEAVKKDPTIPAYAYKKNVVLVTPTSLFGFMKLVHKGWSLYNTQKNQEQIAHEANLVVERIDKLFKALEDADKSYESAHDKLILAMKLAADEGQCVKGPALKIIKLRENVEKQLKSKALADAEA